MNIWLINQYAIGNGCPGGTRHFSLAKELVSRGHNVMIIASNIQHLTKSSAEVKSGRKYWSELHSGVRFFFISSPSYAGNISRMWNMVVFSWRVLVLGGIFLRESGRPDIIVGSTPQLLSALTAYWISVRFKAGFVLEVRDLWPESFVALGLLSKSHPVVLIFRIIEKYLYRKSQKIVTLLPYSFRHIRANGGPEIIQWIPNGVDLSMVPPATEPHESDHVTFMYAGAHGVPNDLDFFLDVIKEVNERGYAERCKFRFVGDGVMKGHLINKAARQALHNLSFEAPVPKKEVYQILSEADVFLLPIPDSPLYKWGYSPNKLFDYFAVARPVLLVCSAEYDPVGEAAGGKTVKDRTIMAVADAIIDLVNISATERWQLGQNGRRYVESRHSISKLTDKLEGLLN